MDVDCANAHVRAREDGDGDGLVPADARRHKTGKLFTLKKVQHNAMWAWARTADDNCGICRSMLTGGSIEAEANGLRPCTENADHFQIGTGACGHAFHVACMRAWLGKRPTCPICSTGEWEFVRIEKIVEF